MEIQEFLAKVTEWAKNTIDIQLLALVGSHARGMAKPDSDIDLIVLTDQPEKYLSDSSWANVFGEIARYQLEDYGKVSSLRIIYKDKVEVEFGFGKTDWAADPEDEGTHQIIQDGIWILFSRNSSVLEQIENFRHEATDLY
jgi:predicted nucleotidyltransferase